MFDLHCFRIQSPQRVEFLLNISLHTRLRSKPSHVSCCYDSEEERFKFSPSVAFLSRASQTQTEVFPKKTEEKGLRN